MRPGHDLGRRGVRACEGQRRWGSAGASNAGVEWGAAVAKTIVAREHVLGDIRREETPMKESILPMRTRVRVGRLALLQCILAWLLGSACGSKTIEEPVSSAGAGATSSSAGMTSAGQCSPGDTRTCVGPGSCRGGQACSSSSEWSDCDCGAQASGGQNAGGQANGGAAEGGSAIQGGAENAGAAGGDGFNSGDEPCPKGDIVYDCSGQCSAEPAVCKTDCSSHFLIGLTKAGDAIARLPSHAGMGCTCGVGPATSFAVTIAFHDSTPNDVIHVVVPPPWYVSYRDGAGCVDTERACGQINPSMTGLGGNDVVVWTADPNAPAINLVAEAGPCP